MLHTRLTAGESTSEAGWPPMQPCAWVSLTSTLLGDSTPSSVTSYSQLKQGKGAGQQAGEVQQ